MGDTSEGSSSAAQRAQRKEPAAKPARPASYGTGQNGTGRTDANGGGARPSTPGTGKSAPKPGDAKADDPKAAGTPSGAPSRAAPRHGFFHRLFKARRDAAGNSAASRPAGPVAPAPRKHSLQNLRNMRVEDVAVPKADIVAAELDISSDDLVNVFRESGMTRLPIYQGTMDTPVGFVHLKDFALKHGFNGNGGGPFELKPLLRPLLFVPPSMPIGVLLQKMQTERRHMALVIDEYGGVDGLVTIEDLIEQVIGEIEDEHDIEEDKLWTREASGSLLALAKTPLEEFEDEVGMSLTDGDEIDEEEIDTLGGLVFMLAGRVPARGEVVPHPAGHEFEVVDADPRRIKRLRVRLKSPQPAHA